MSPDCATSRVAESHCTVGARNRWLFGHPTICSISASCICYVTEAQALHMLCWQGAGGRSAGTHFQSKHTSSRLRFPQPQEVLGIQSRAEAEDLPRAGCRLVTWLRRPYAGDWLLFSNLFPHQGRQGLGKTIWLSGWIFRL